MPEPIAAARQSVVVRTESDRDVPGPAAPTVLALLRDPAEAGANEALARRLIAAPLALAAGAALAPPKGGVALVRDGGLGPTLRLGPVELGAPPDAMGAHFVGLSFQVDGGRASVGVAAKATPVDGGPTLGTSVRVPVSSDE